MRLPKSLLLALLGLSACTGMDPMADAVLTGGDSHRGPGLIRQRGCGSCHEIPGVPGANAKVGPSLAGFANRLYVAGELTNTPDNLMAWIQDPHRFEPKTVMPNTGVTPEEARDIAAYLYTLK